MSTAPQQEIEKTADYEVVSALENGLELWKVSPNALREQDVNARFMSKEMMERLTLTIRRDKRLESFPLCAKTEKGIEIISGHHRVRAALQAKMKWIYCIVDVSGLSMDEIRAKQLAHNSIAGEDDAQLIKRIYESIGDAECKLEAFVDKKIEVKMPKAEQLSSLSAMEYRNIGIIFLPSEHERWQKVADEIKGMYPELYLAEMEKFEPFRKLVQRIQKEFDIKAFGTTLDKMAEMMEVQMGAEPDESEVIPLRDLFKTGWISKDSAKIIQQALEKAVEKEDCTGKTFTRMLELWAADYLSGS